MNGDLHPLFEQVLGDFVQGQEVARGATCERPRGECSPVDLAGAGRPVESDESQLRRRASDLAADKYVLEQELKRERATPALKREDLVKGKVYRVRLTDGKWTEATFLYASVRAHWPNKQVRTHFNFHNVKTGRLVEIKSLRKVREVEG